MHACGRACRRAPAWRTRRAGGLCTLWMVALDPVDCGLGWSSFCPRHNTLFVLVQQCKKQCSSRCSQYSSSQCCSSQRSSQCNSTTAGPVVQQSVQQHSSATAWIGRLLRLGCALMSHCAWAQIDVPLALQAGPCRARFRGPPTLVRSNCAVGLCRH